MNDLCVSRRRFLQATIAAGAVALAPELALCQDVDAPLEEFGYSQVRVSGAVQMAQRENASSILMGLDEDSLLKPFREMSGGRAAPGVSLGGWYEWKPDYNHHHDDAGLAPGATFGQWTSAMSRFYAASRFGGSTGDAAAAARVVRLHKLLRESIGTGYFEKTRFAGYSFDKLVCGLMDAHRLVADGSSFEALDTVRAAATPTLPGRAVDREEQWKAGADISWMWDETYTLPENLYLVSKMGAGQAYRAMARAYLANASFFDPLAQNRNVMVDRHAYSYVNALCSAMQAYFVDGSTKHLAAARNGFAYLEQQSFATGGWGPDELLRSPGYDELAKSLTASHNGFETPCGSYAHMKLTRYLLRATRDGHYGDSMERVFYNTILGALPLQPDGRAFYSSDYNVTAKRVYSVHRWPCCSGTMPQVVADYGVNTYLREPGAVWVNLYQPSELRWDEGGVPVELQQRGTYPDTDAIQIRISAARPVTFGLHLRIPAWAGAGARLTVNGVEAGRATVKGFASVSRRWSSGDVVELGLPMSLRLEPLPAYGAAHPETVALCRGPLVLFALREEADAERLTASAGALLNAERVGPLAWRVVTSGGERRFVPFTEIGERKYTTYLTLA